MVTFLNMKAIFDWCTVSDECKHARHKDTCFKEIGLHAQNMAAIQGLAKVNIFGEDFKNRFENDNHLTLNRCFATYKEVGVELKVCI